MEIHKVKPVHGWREFFGEVGVIVLGVLIALGAEQIVERLHWRHQIEASHDALAVELGDAKGTAIERLRVYGCVQRRLSQLARFVDDADKVGRLPPIGDIGYPPSRPWSQTVWNGILSAQIVSHVQRDERIGLSDSYSMIENLRDGNDREKQLWADLYQLVGPGRVLDHRSADVLRGTISQARFSNRYMALISAQLLEALRKNIGVELEERGTRQALRADLHTYAACRPIAPSVPPIYGAAPWRNVDSDILQGLIDVRKEVAAASASRH